MTGPAADLSPDLSAAIALAIRTLVDECRRRQRDGMPPPGAVFSLSVSTRGAMAWLSTDTVALAGTPINGGDVDGAFAALLAELDQRRPYTLDEINRTFGIGDRT